MHNSSLLRNKRSMARTTCLKEKKENLYVFAYLTIQHIPSPSKWLPIDINNKPMNQLLVKHLRDMKH
jgi:hypothetical protein